MKKLLSIFVIIALAIPSVSFGAITVKKAASVTAKKADTMESATSLLPSVIGLVGNVKNLKAQQQQLDAECVPTADEVSTINSLIKEWAKVGGTTADSAVSSAGAEPCGGGDNSNESAFQDWMELNNDKNDMCYVVFKSSADLGMIWEGYPKALYAKILPPDGNAKNATYRSNIYDIMGMIPFGEEDFTISELNKVRKLIEKAEKCAPSKIAAAKREIWGGFLTQTLSSVGQTTGAAGTGSVIQAVSSMGGSGNIQSLLPSLGSMAMQSFDK
ncbi:MAG: hypothetical protein IKZ49_00190 [Alphaproteobacteria bacterium]|nr:hypothetical protein [Alphaproteobacteria bacterium]